MRVAYSWLAPALVLAVQLDAAQIHDNGPCCVVSASFSDEDTNFWQADDVALNDPVTLGGIRFWGLYVASSGLFTNSVPETDAFTLRVFADDGGQPGALIGQSALDGSRSETGATYGTTPLRWHLYEMS